MAWSRPGASCLSLCGPDQLLEPRVVLDVAPPPVGGPRQPNAMSRVRRDLLLEKPERRVAIAQEDVRERLERQELALRIHIGTSLRPGEHVSRAVTEPGAHQHGSNRDLRL